LGNVLREAISRMLTLKAALYALTVITAFFFGFWEMRLKRQLTDDAPKPHENVSDFGLLNDLSKALRRERFLETLPHQRTSKLRMVVSLKFMFIAILIVEVLAFQR